MQQKLFQNQYNILYGNQNQSFWQKNAFLRRISLIKTKASQKIKTISEKKKKKKKKQKQRGK